MHCWSQQTSLGSRISWHSVCLGERSHLLFGGIDAFWPKIQPRTLKSSAKSAFQAKGTTICATKTYTFKLNTLTSPKMLLMVDFANACTTLVSAGSFPSTGQSRKTQTPSNLNVPGDITNHLFATSNSKTY